MTRGRRLKKPPEVRVVEDKYGNRRALYVWEWDRELKPGERLLRGGSELLGLKVGRADRAGEVRNG